MVSRVYDRKELIIIILLILDDIHVGLGQYMYLSA